MYNEQYTIYNIQYTIYNIQYAIYSIHFTIYNIQHTTYNIQYIGYKLQVYKIHRHIDRQSEREREKERGREREMDNEEDTMDTTLANKSGAASTATSELHAPCVGGHVCGGRRGRRGRRRGTKDEGTKSVFLRAARLRLLKRLGATWRVETRAVSRQDPRLERAVGIFEREDNLVNSPNRGHCSNSHHPVCDESWSSDLGLGS